MLIKSASFYIIFFKKRTNQTETSWVNWVYC
jgi:hypothetical protein